MIEILSGFPNGVCKDLDSVWIRFYKEVTPTTQGMAEADKHPMAEPAKPFRLRCLGVIAYLEGDYAAARQNLEATILAVEPIKWRPFKDGHLAISRAYLCCVLAKIGDLAGAKKNFALAKECLLATNEIELLAECRQTTGDYS